MRSRLPNNLDASIAKSKGGPRDSIRAKLLRKSLQHGGLKDESPLPAKLPQRGPKTLVPSKPAAAEHYVSKPVRQRQPVEYLGYLITTEQQLDGTWVANFVHMGGTVGCVQNSAPYPVSYAALSDAKRKIDAASSGPAGNRKHERVPVALEGVIFTKGATHECQILDLSQGGARLCLEKPIDLEEELGLYIKGFGRFRAQVVRSSDKEMGVRFIVDNAAVSSLLSGLSNYVRGLDIAETEERKEIRVPTSIVAVCRLANGTAIPCEIINASIRSMSLRISERPPVGSLVTLGGTKVRVVRHHSKGIAVQCIPSPSPKSDRFTFKDD